MTDPGDRATEDANTRLDMPNATPDTVNPDIGDEGQMHKIKQNEKDQARKSSEGSDLFDKPDSSRPLDQQ